MSRTETIAVVIAVSRAGSQDRGKLLSVIVPTVGSSLTIVQVTMGAIDGGDMWVLACDLRRRVSVLQLATCTDEIVLHRSLAEHDIETSPAQDPCSDPARIELCSHFV